MKLLGLGTKVYKVLDGTVPEMFRELDPDEEQKFLKWARAHSDQEVRAIYHPVVQNEMLLIQERQAASQGVPVE